MPSSPASFMMASTAAAAASEPGMREDSGWLSFEPSRYRAMALSIFRHDRR